MAIVRESFLSGPAITPVPSTLLDQATVVDSDRGFGFRNESGLWESYNCMDTIVPTTICPTDPPAAKDFAEPDWAPGFSFSVYGGTVCRLVGLDRENAKERLTEVFLANESRGVETALVETRFVAGPEVPPGPDLLWEAAVDITPTPGTPVSPSCGLALLEGYAGRTYAGLPLIHAPREIASRIVHSRNTVEGRFHSMIGSPIANTSPNQATGPTGVVAPAGSHWMWATGAVLVERGPMRVIEAVDHVNNENFLLAERSYRVAVDCFAAGVLVEVCG